MLRGSKHAYTIGGLRDDYCCNAYYYCSVFNGYGGY